MNLHTLICGDVSWGERVEREREGRGAGMMWGPTE